MGITRIVDPRLRGISPWTFYAVMVEARLGSVAMATGTSSYVTYNDGFYLVTNLHNMTGCDPISGQPLSWHGGVPDRLAAWFMGFKQLDEHTIEYNLDFWNEKEFALHDHERRPNWLVHPKHKDVDLACLPIKPAGGMIPALRIDNYVEPQNVIIGDSIQVIGYPKGIPSQQRLPQMTSGEIASSFLWPFRNRPRFLIDCDTHPGNSGSPVLGFSGHISNVTAFDENYQVPEMRVLGVYSGRINPPAGRAPDIPSSKWSLGQVWKLSLVREIIESKIRGEAKILPSEPV